MCIRSLEDNTNYTIKLPYEDKEMYAKFVATIEAMRSFDAETFTQNNTEKCRHCIYEPACDRGLL